MPADHFSGSLQFLLNLVLWYSVFCIVCFPALPRLIKALVRRYFGLGDSLACSLLELFSKVIYIRGLLFRLSIMSRLVPHDHGA